MKTIKERARFVAQQIYEEIGLSKHSINRVSEIIAGKLLEQKEMDIENAGKGVGDYLFDIGYPDDWMRDSPNLKSGEKRFRKSMEE